MFGKSPPEVARTCKRCSHVRFVPKRDRNRKPNRGFKSFTERTTRGMMNSLTAYELEQANLRSLVACPQCGSQSFKDGPAK